MTFSSQCPRCERAKEYFSTWIEDEPFSGFQCVCGHRFYHRSPMGPEITEAEAKKASPYATRELLRDVRAGLMSAREGAGRLGWTIDDVMMANYGKVTL